MCSTVWVAVIICCVALLAFVYKYFVADRGPNPFAADSREPVKLLVTDKKEKNKVLKQGFVASKIPENLDAVVIGSGVGGLGIAVLLAKVGKRVLVLEQHDRAGGCCHTFSEKGFEFDVGIHYIGNLKEHRHFRCMIDQLTNGQLQWEMMDNPYDHVVIGSPENRRVYPIYYGRERYEAELKRCFPGEEAAIDKYIHLVKKAAFGAWVLFVLKLVPLFVVRFLISTGLAHRLSPFLGLASRSLSEVVSELTENKDLRTVFSYIFGTYGNMPKDASFAIHSLMVYHYMYGAWYPKGGASEIAYHMIPIIEKAGGAVLVRAPVNRILFNEAHEAYGVSVRKGQEEVHIHAPMIISDAGLLNTYQVLIPRELQALPAIQKQLNIMKSGEGGLSLFFGLDGTKEELGLKADNYWIFKENDLDGLMESYKYKDREESPMNVPMIFVASPSAKDPTWADRKPGKSTLTVISFASYEWFEEWKDEKATNRGPDYNALKDAFIRAITEMVVDIFPKIKDKIEYVDAGTPITNQHYIAAPHGEIYGCDHGRARFGAEISAAVRPQTPLKNLYLTGQDVFLCGFAGALGGALTCGSVILNRNLYLDTVTMARRLQKTDQNKKHN